MNSIIEAQEEYFAYQAIGMAPGMPMHAHRSFAITTEGCITWRNYALEEKESKEWNAKNRIYKIERQAQLWDRKIRGEKITIPYCIRTM